MNSVFELRKQRSQPLGFQRSSHNPRLLVAGVDGGGTATRAVIKVVSVPARFVAPLPLKPLSLLVLASVCFRSSAVNVQLDQQKN